MLAELIKFYTKLIEATINLTIKSVTEKFQVADMADGQAVLTC